MAAAYAFHIAQNQPFLDGNKRVGLNACLLFLALNGWEVVDPPGSLYDAMIAFAEGTLEKPGMADTSALWPSRSTQSRNSQALHLPSALVRSAHSGARR